MVGWSLFSYLEYGGIHIFERKNFPFGFWNGIYNSINWIIALGAVTPFSILIIRDLYRMKIGRIIILTGALLFFAITLMRTPFFYTGLKVGILGGCFFGNGLSLLLICFFYGYQRLWKEKYKDKDEEGLLLILLLWILGSMAFIILFTPFPAVRHVIVAIPAILLILGSYIFRIKSQLSG